MLSTTLVRMRSFVLCCCRAQPDLFDNVDISSVDAFQGREADVVVFTTVRCNRQRRLGFVADRRRLNVAITRPRRCAAYAHTVHEFVLGPRTMVKEGFLWSVETLCADVPQGLGGGRVPCHPEQQRGLAAVAAVGGAAVSSDVRAGASRVSVHVLTR